jgi:hypothetical protein
LKKVYAAARSEILGTAAWLPQAEQDSRQIIICQTQVKRNVKNPAVRRA